jgi:Ca2+-transporting ATPase
MQKNWHNLKIEDVITFFDTSETGLSQVEADLRLKKNGPNSLPQQELESYFGIFLRQFKSPLIYVLLLASIVVYFSGEITDSIIILVILFFNSIVGTVQEGRAQNTLRALNQFVKTQAIVYRDGKETVIPDWEVVEGDILHLQEGEKVAADARIIYANKLKTDESSLTGETGAVSKTEGIITNPNVTISDRKNMVFKGSSVVAGIGKAVVVGTALNTEIGTIAKEIKDIEADIPLKAKIANLSQLIIIAVVTIALVIFFAGILTGKPLGLMFGTVVSFAVSIIPESLPIVMTLVLAAGVWRMSRQNVLVKKLQAVEALGQAQIIAVDKTGTVTKNEMMVKKLFLNDHFFDITGSGYEPKGEVFISDEAVDPLNHPELVLMGKISAYVSDARIFYNEQDKKWGVMGDPTEAALLTFAQKIGHNKDELEKETPLIAEIPFDYSTKYHATVHKTSKGNILSVVGAPEVVLALCEQEWFADKEISLTNAKKAQLEKNLAIFMEQGLRVLAFAVDTDYKKSLVGENISNLSFLGFVGIQDVIRKEAIDSVKRAEESGIKVIMITGDHKISAMAIAKEAGIFHDGDEVMTGAELDQMQEQLFLEKLKKTTVFARVTPEHKLKIIEAYKKLGVIIAMTGDGVNDALSLVAADLGVAMGGIGTEVAKEAADLVLMDDNFGSIVAAVEEGRSIYKTIKKVILYLFSTAFGEVLILATAVFSGFPLPLLPGQILWLNFVTDSFLDVSLGMEPKEKDLLKDGVRKPSKYIVDKTMVVRMFIMAIPMALACFAVFYLFAKADLIKARTLTMCTMAAFHWMNAWNCRDERKSVFQNSIFKNKILLLASVFVVTLQVAAVYSPGLQKLLHLVPLSMSDWLMILGLASSIVLFEETRKLFVRVWQKDS